MKIKKWLFHQGALSNGAARDADESLFHPVCVPHTWNNLDGQDGTPGGKNINDTDYYRGDGWYRTDLTLAVEDADKRHFIRFQGVNMQCDVYLNEKYLGSHKGGYTAFAFELSPYLHFGGGNLLAVRVNNAFVPEIAPLTADFTFYGGIYRDVELLQKNACGFCCMDTATRGLKVDVPSVTRELAVCRMEAVAENTLPVEKTLTVSALLDGMAAEQTVCLAPGERKPVSFTFQVPDPHLWHGREDPYLYSASLTMREGTEALDTVSDEIGLRFFHVDPEKGFYLNGRSYPLRGVSRHQDREALGNALTEEEHQEDFQILYEIGATAVRLAHYPQAEFFYRLCDRHGLLVWAEIPFVDQVGGSGSYAAPDEAMRAFFDGTKQQLVELIRQNRNHPSIFCWGLQNEVRAKYDSVMMSFMEELHKLAKAEDPSRLTTQATNHKGAHQWKSDLIAWNVYPGWYGMRRTQLGWFMDRMRKVKGIERPIGLSEYGAGGNPFQHEEHPGKPKHNGNWHPEEYQALCHETFLQQIEQRDYLWCTFVWNLFDFGSDGRNEGDMPGRNDKGLVSFDRKIKKDAYYVYQSRWSREPMLQIAQSRFTQRKKKRTEVKVYSNMEQMELYLNGKQVGIKQQKNNRQTGVYLWKNIWLKKGENQIKAIAHTGETQLQQEIVWTVL